MTLTGPVGQVGIILASNAPVTPSAIPGGMAYVDMTPNSPNLVTMAIGALPLTANVTMPPNFTYLYQAVIYQGATLDPATNATTPSNGIMARLGSQ